MSASMSPSGCISESVLRKYLAEELGPDDASAVADHVGRCECCQAALQQLAGGLPGAIRDALSVQPVRPRMRSEGSDSALGRTMPAPPDGYRIVRLLGTGSYGEVWLTEDLRLPREVVLKTIRSRLDPERCEREHTALQKDATLLAALQHPNIVTVYDWLTAGDTDFLSMQYVRGGSLASRIKTIGQP